MLHQLQSILYHNFFSLYIILCIITSASALGAASAFFSSYLGASFEEAVAAAGA